MLLGLMLPGVLRSPLETARELRQRKRSLGLVSWGSGRDEAQRKYDLPNIASTTWSDSLSAAGKSSVNGMSKFFS